MPLVIDASVAERIPAFSLGLILYEGVHISPSPKKLQSRINLFVEHLRLQQEGKSLTDIEEIAQWRSVFKQLGIDPSRYRPSSEALLRRLLQGSPFHWVNSAVDVNNFMSIHTALPFGIYNADKVKGKVVCKIGGEHDAYDALNGRTVQMEGKLVLCDEQGPFGSPFVDSVRTSVTEEATHLMHVIFFSPATTPAKREEVMGSTARMVTEINGGEAVLMKIVSVHE